ncbi:MAG: hypothetical protein PVJ84_03440, partial [Desulfobacteraceae bacterium]
MEFVRHITRPQSQHRRIVERPLDALTGLDENLALGGAVGRGHSPLAFGQLDPAILILRPNAAFKQVDAGSILIHLHIKLGAFDHSIDKRSEDFKAARPAAE